MRNTPSTSNAFYALSLALLTLPACSASDGEPAASGLGSGVGAAADGTNAATGMGVDTTSMNAGTNGTDVSGMSGETGNMGVGTDSMDIGGMSGETSGMGAATGDTEVGVGGNSTQTSTGSGGMPAGTGGLGSGGTSTGDSGGSGTGGVSTGMGGSGNGGTTAPASDSGGAAGGGGAATGGSGGAMNEPVMRPPVQVEGMVPSQYGSPVANGGEWTPHTYPVYYYTTQSSGLSPDDTLEMQDSPIMKPCNIYTPPDYDPEVEYPLIIVMHGITDNHNTWMERGDPKPDVLLDNLITSEAIEPIIAVFAQGDAHPDWASHDNYTDTAGYMVFGDELMNDLLPYIEANFSVKTDRNYRAFSGFSYGGMQTVNVGLSHHLKDFAWFGAFAAAGGAYGASQIAQNLESQDVSTYPLNHFYSMAGDGDSASGTVESYERDLPGASPAVTSENFTAQVVSGNHNYPTVTIGLYNFLRIAFGL